MLFMANNLKCNQSSDLSHTLSSPSNQAHKPHSKKLIDMTFLPGAGQTVGYDAM